MQGHIKLGAPGALRDYLLVDPRQYTAMAANPMAARVSSGGKYGEIEAWSTFVQEDWQMGVGQRDPEAGGFSYSDLDTRVPRQIITAPAIQFVPPQYCSALDRGYVGHMPVAADTTFVFATIGTGETYDRVAIKVKTPPAAKMADPGFLGCAIYGKPNYTSTSVFYSILLQEDDAGRPGDTLYSHTEDTDVLLPGYQWLAAAHDGTGLLLAPNTYYWLTLVGWAGTISLAGSDEVHTSTSMTALVMGDVALWGASPFCPFFTVFWGYRADPGTTTRPSAFVRGSASWFHFISQSEDAAGAANVRIMSTQTHGYWTLADTETGVMNTKHVALFDGKVYFALGGKMAHFPATYGAVTTTATDAHGFEVWNGYLWRFYNNAVYYSADASTWTGPIEIGGSDYAVRSMCGLDQQVYVATDEALWMIAPGDIAVGIMRWGTVSTENGGDMINHQNALYIAVGGRVVRFTPDGTAQDIFASRDDDLVTQRLGRVVSLAGMNTQVVALVQAATNTGAGSLSAWAYNGQGWHHITTLPSPREYVGGERAELWPSAGLYYDYGVSKYLWIAPTAEMAYQVKLPDYALNPYNDDASLFMPVGWLEIPKFYGGQVELAKDWESVRVWGDMSASRPVKVYWQDEGTDTDTAGGVYFPNWEYLGEATTSGQELRWSDYATRPNSRWIRLALEPYTTIVGRPPRVEAVACKFLPMVTDRTRWQLSILVSPEQEMLDGERNTYTVTQQVDHLVSMVQRVPPCIFEDIDGTQYEVKVLNAGRNVQQFDVLPDGVIRVQYVYRITLEQVTDGAYG